MQDDNSEDKAGATAIDRTRARYLTPDVCRIHVGKHGVLSVTVKDEKTYGGVYAAYAFPVVHTNKYISLMQSSGEGEDLEIGIIRDLDDFFWDQAALVREALARRYFIHTITKINDIGLDHGLVALDAETDKGRVKCLVQWKGDRAVDFGRSGKLLIDVDGNRYAIPNVDELPPGERSAFTRLIYW